MKHSLKLIFTVLLIVAIHQVSKSQSIRLAAEWEKQERVHLAWFGNEKRDTVLCRVIQALQPDMPITLNIPEDTISVKVKKNLLTYGIDTTLINFNYDPFVDFWTRDPIFFVFKGTKLIIVCFNYSMYGVYPDILDEQIPDAIKKIGEYDERLARKLKLPIIKSDFVFEGGGIETNGDGTFLSIKEMALQRNSTKTITEIEAELSRTLGAKKIIWLKEGFIEDKTFKNYAPFYKNYFGGGANMHIDELCRFVDKRSVILPIIDKKDIHKSPVDSINYYMLEENYHILQRAVTNEGKKIIIHRIPMPEVEQLKYTYIIDNKSVSEFKPFGFSTGDTIYRVPAASYMNYFVSNKVVLIAKYWKPGMTESQKQKDEDARKLFSKLFPDKKIVQIYTLSINRGGGGLHCMTHEQPALKD